MWHHFTGDLWIITHSEKSVFIRLADIVASLWTAEKQYLTFFTWSGTLLCENNIKIKYNRYTVRFIRKRFNSLFPHTIHHTREFSFILFFHSSSREHTVDCKRFEEIGWILSFTRYAVLHLRLLATWFARARNTVHINSFASTCIDLSHSTIVQRMYRTNYPRDVYLLYRRWRSFGCDTPVKLQLTLTLFTLKYIHI